MRVVADMQLELQARNVGYILTAGVRYLIDLYSVETHLREGLYQIYLMFAKIWDLKANCQKPLVTLPTGFHFLTFLIA